MKTVVKYGYDNELVRTDYFITSVKDVLPGTTQDQLSLLQEEEED
jgi:hypothetical protein